MQEAVCWDGKSVVLTWLKCEDLLADRTCVQTVFAPQEVQKLKVGQVEGKFGSGIDRGSALRRESGDEDRIEAQQGGGVISFFKELGV